MSTLTWNIKQVGSQIATNPFDRSKIKLGNYVPVNPLNNVPIQVLHSDRPARTHSIEDHTQVSAWMGFVENPDSPMRTHRTPDSTYILRQISEQQQVGSAGGHDAWLKFHHLSTVISSGDNVGSTGKRTL